MKEFIDKLISRLGKESDEWLEIFMADSKKGHCNDYADGSNDAFNEAISIVNQLAEEYKVSEMPTGWIACSERLPDTEHISGVSESVLVTTNIHSIFTAEYHRNGKWLDDVGDWSLDVIAWMPLPAPYTEGE